jgi:hypothetical protein
LVARRSTRFDNRLPGFVIVAGAVVLAAGAALPWLKASTAKLSLGVDVQLQQTYGGIADGGYIVLVLAAVALVAGLAVMGRSRGRGFFGRLVALVFGVAGAAFGAYCVAAPEDVYVSLLDVSSTVQDLVRAAAATPALSIKAQTGAYLMALGGLVILVGVLMPGRRSSVADLEMMRPASRAMTRA